MWTVLPYSFPLASQDFLGLPVAEPSLSHPRPARLPPPTPSTGSLPPLLDSLHATCPPVPGHSLQTSYHFIGWDRGKRAHRVPEAIGCLPGVRNMVGDKPNKGLDDLGSVFSTLKLILKELTTWEGVRLRLAPDHCLRKEAVGRRVEAGRVDRQLGKQSMQGAWPS